MQLHQHAIDSGESAPMTKRPVYNWHQGDKLGHRPVHRAVLSFGELGWVRWIGDVPESTRCTACYLVQQQRTDSEGATDPTDECRSLRPPGKSLRDSSAPALLRPYACQTVSATRVLRHRVRRWRCVAKGCPQGN